MEKILEKLQWLCQTPSPTGMTREILQGIQDRYPQVAWSRTRKGTLLGQLPGKGKKIALACHIDTLGLMVQKIKDNGRLEVTTLGGFPLNYVEQENVLVHTLEGKTYEGTVRLKDPAVHASKDAESAKRDAQSMEVVLDYLVEDKKAVQDLGICNGDYISLDPRFRLAGDGYIKSRHLDDKASAAILLTLIDHWEDFDYPPVTMVFSCYEEVGHGACGLDLDVEDFIAVDMGVIGEKLEAKETDVSICRKDSSGPYDYDLTKDLIDLAKKEGLDFATDVFPFYGSDASAARSSGLDARFALIGPGVSASHGYERTHKRGLENTYRLLEAYLRAQGSC